MLDGKVDHFEDGDADTRLSELLDGWMQVKEKDGKGLGDGGEEKKKVKNAAD